MIFEERLNSQGKNPQGFSDEPCPTPSPGHGWRFALFLFITVFLGVMSLLYIYGLKLNGPAIRSDGIGYYLYLPSLFIDHDITLQNTIARNAINPIPGWGGAFLSPSQDGFLNRHPMGTAILESPSFLGACCFSAIFGLPQDGFSATFQIANMFSALFYMGVGLYFIYRILIGYFSERLSVFTLVALTFGTNLFHYATYDGSESHIYSFALFAIYFQILLSYQKLPSVPLAVFAGFILGLIIITRNVNIVFGLLPLTIGFDRSKGVERFRPFLIQGLLFCLACAIPLLPQLLYWHQVTGHFIVYSYGHEAHSGEHFTFSRPQFWDYLFGVRKGVFFWTPLVGLSLLGFFCLPPILHFWRWPLAFCIMLHIYIHSCWGNWGGSFSSRPFVDLLPLLAVPLASSFSWLYRRARPRLVNAGIVILILEELILMHSYWIGVIPFDGTTWDTLLHLPEGYAMYWHWLWETDYIVLPALIFGNIAMVATGLAIAVKVQVNRQAIR